tara:strand:+ start:331 stop:1071 length:741 start_codon:yes stop_codon:yes gene_type:complete
MLNPDQKYRLSPFYNRQSSLSAKFANYDNNWILAESFSDNNKESQALKHVAIADISNVGKMIVNCSNFNQYKKLFGIVGDYKPGKILTGKNKTVRDDLPDTITDSIYCVLTDDLGLLLYDEKQHFYVIDVKTEIHNNAEKFTYDVYFTDVSSVYCGLYLLGPDSVSILSRLTEFNLNSKFSCAYVSLANVQCILLNQNINDISGYQLYFERSYGEYIWDVLFNSGKDYNLTPIGEKTLQNIGWKWL